VTEATRGRCGDAARAPYPLGVADAPIGIFDSGYGGLTVARSVLDQLPHESVVYFGDTARAPYGPRPIAETRRFALECLDRLVDHGVKVLVIACNTASAAMLHDARERYAVPVVEVIRPAVRRAAAATRSSRVGVISTQGTHNAQAYLDAFAAAPQIEVVSQPCPRFVEFVEAGVTGGKELLDVAREYLEPVAARDVDTLVSSAEETAKDVFRVLSDGDLLRPDDLPPPTLAFSTTGDAEEFRRRARRFLGPEVGTVFGNRAETS